MHGEAHLSLIEGEGLIPVQDYKTLPQPIPETALCRCYRCSLGSRALEQLSKIRSGRSEIRQEFRWTPLDAALSKALAAFATYKGNLL